MEKIVIDKGVLKEYKSLLVVLENCDVYEIDVEDILDVYCEAELIEKKNCEYHTSDGFIKISARASQAVECSVLRDQEIGTKRDHRLKERLGMCGGCADMTSFSLRNKKNRDMHIYVPYNPLEDIMHGCEIELSNCPSFEVDSEGNMIIAFGKSSKQPTRKDNNYAELVEGWKDAFGDYEPEILKVNAESLLTFGDEQKIFSFYFKICDKNSKRDFAKLVFMDCKDIAIEMFFPKEGDCEIVMSKMADGRIYVGFDGLGIDFICASVLEYDYYCNRDKD
jgi:hypothetical protein